MSKLRAVLMALALVASLLLVGPLLPANAVALATPTLDSFSLTESTVSHGAKLHFAYEV